MGQGSRFSKYTEEVHIAQEARRAAFKVHHILYFLTNESEHTLCCWDTVVAMPTAAELEPLCYEDCST